MEMLLFILLPAGAAPLISLGVRLIARRWSSLRVSLVAALTVPAMIWAMCAYVFLASTGTPPEKCGVDACGMAMAASMVIASAAVGIFVIGWILAYLLQRRLARA